MPRAQCREVRDVGFNLTKQRCLNGTSCISWLHIFNLCPYFHHCKILSNQNHGGKSTFSITSMYQLTPSSDLDCRDMNKSQKVGRYSKSFYI